MFQTRQESFRTLRDVSACAPEEGAPAFVSLLRAGRRVNPPVLLHRIRSALRDFRLRFTPVPSRRVNRYTR